MPTFLQFRKFVVAGAVFVAALLAWTISDRISDQRARTQQAAQAYLFALPLVLTDITREETFKHPAAVNAEPNRFYTIPVLADVRFRTVIRPNVDTLYSVAWLDLDKEPVLLTIPPSDGRYFVIQFMDAWTNVFAAPGIRTIGKQAKQFVIVGPGFRGAMPARVPAGAERVVAPTNMVWALGRVHASDASDLRAAQVLQHRIDIRPVSRIGDASFVPSMPDPSGRGAKRTDPIDIVKNMSAEQFFQRFYRVARQNPPAHADAPFIRDVMRPLGLAPDEARAWTSLPQSTRDTIERGIKATWDVMTERAAVEKSRTPTGWAGFSNVQQIGTYGTNYAVRAGVAVFGLGANLPEDAIYLNATVDGLGQPLKGGLAYRMTFAAGELPPVKGFWSVTLYDRKGYLVDHPLNRYAIKQTDPLVYNPDGSLTILIQPSDPGPGKRANWLPSPPDGNFVLSLRAYWPHERLLKQQWMPPAVTPA